MLDRTAFGSAQFWLKHSVTDIRLVTPNDVVVKYYFQMGETNRLGMEIVKGENLPVPFDDALLIESVYDESLEKFEYMLRDPIIPENVGIAVLVETYNQM